MSAWKDEYKVRWPARIRRAKAIEYNLKSIESNFERSERALARRIFWNRFFDAFYFALVGGVIIAAVWFALSLFGIVPR